MRMINDYRAITNRNYRLVCNLMIPVVLGVILALIEIGMSRFYTTSVEPALAAILMTFVEVMADYWGFGAICVKGCLGMDYLKTSTRGKAMLENALMADLLVRPGRIAVCMVITVIPGLFMSGSIVKALPLAILFTSNMSVWMLNITRHIQTIHAVSVISMLTAAVSGIAAFYTVMLPELQRYVWIIAVALAALLVTGIYVTSWHMQRNVEMSYRDEL